MIPGCLVEFGPLGDCGEYKECDECDGSPRAIIEPDFGEVIDAIVEDERIWKRILGGFHAM